MVISLPVYLGIIAALALERGFELYIAQRNATRAFAAGAVEIGQRHYRAMVALHGAFLVACAVESIARGSGASAAVAAPAIAAELFAQFLRYWVIFTLGPRWNTRIIVFPEANPVTSGPFRFVRHPNYLAVTIELVAVPLIGGAWVTAIVFSLGNAILLMVRIPAEERALGRWYAGAFAGLPRFLPRIRQS